MEAILYSPHPHPRAGTSALLWPAQHQLGARQQLKAMGRRNAGECRFGPKHPASSPSLGTVGDETGNVQHRLLQGAEQWEGAAELSPAEHHSHSVEM